METYATLVAHGCAGGHVEWTARERRARALLCGKTERHVQPPAKKWPGVALSPGYASRSVFGSRVPGVAAMLSQQTHAPAHAAYVERERWADAAAAALRRKRLHARVPLPADADARIRAALAAPDAVAATCCDIPVCGRDLATLQGRAWLNDEVINAYCQLLAARTAGDASLPRAHAFSSFFYPRLRERGPEAVRGATRRLDPPALARDVLLFPVHLGAHWCMAVADLRARTLVYCDSLSGRGDACLASVAAWLEAEARDKPAVLRARRDCPFGADYDNPSLSGWEVDARRAVPVQRNGHDCGVFSLLCARCAVLGLPFDSFSQADIPYWRARISLELLNARLM